MPLLHSACLGIGYGLLLNNRPLIQINTVAAFCVGIYLLSFVYVSQSKVGQDFGTNHMSHNTGSYMVAQLPPSKKTEVGHYGSADQTHSNGISLMDQ